MAADPRRRSYAGEPGQRLALRPRARPRFEGSAGSQVDDALTTPLDHDEDDEGERRSRPRAIVK